MIKRFVLLTLIILLLTTSLFSKTIISEITENSAQLTIDKVLKADNVIVIMSASGKISEIKTQLKDFSKKEISLKDAQKIDETTIVLYNGKKPGNIKIKELKSASKYFISIFSALDMKLLEDFTLLTLAEEPKEQAENIIFKNTKSDNITLLFNKGKGQKRVIFVTQEGKSVLPVDGKNYIASTKYGDSSAFVSGTTYCVENGNSKEVKITNLEHSEYLFQIFEYNGLDETANYLISTTSQNPRTKTLPLPPPVALEAIGITESGFIARWEAMKGPLNYYIDISKDENFSSFVEPYNNMDIGSISEMEVVDLEPGTYYYRVRAFTNKVKSDNSNIIKIEVK